MRIHTDAPAQELHRALQNLPGVYFERLQDHRSATHRYAYEVNLAGNGTWSNSGKQGAGSYTAATWDEWGVFMAQIFAIDPETRMGGTQKQPVYADATDFEYKTGSRFGRADVYGKFTPTPGGLPEDTHKRHRWIYAGVPREQDCSRCTATRRF